MQLIPIPSKMIEHGKMPATLAPHMYNGNRGPGTFDTVVLTIVGPREPRPALHRASMAVERVRGETTSPIDSIGRALIAL